MTRESGRKIGSLRSARDAQRTLALVRLQGAVSLRSDLEKLTTLTRSWVADIQNDVGGTHLERKALAALLDTSIAENRFVQITGLPGNGKSVLMRQRVEADLLRDLYYF
jgi:hypothetical protein